MLRFVQSVGAPSLIRGLKPHLRKRHSCCIGCRVFNSQAVASTASNTLPGSQHRWMSVQTNDIGDRGIDKDSHIDLAEKYIENEGAHEPSMKHRILQSFDKKISENIQEVISLVDNGRTGTQESPATEENADSDQPVKQRARRIVLATRWRNAVDRESYQQRREQRGLKNEGSRMSTEDAWDEVMLELDIPFDETTSLKSPSPLQGVSNSLRDERSPILGLKIDEDGFLENLNGTGNEALSRDGTTTETSDEDFDEDLAEIRRYFSDRNSSSSDSRENTICKAIAILGATKAEEWQLIDYRVGSNDFSQDVETSGGIGDTDVESDSDSDSDSDMDSDAGDLHDIYDLLDDLHHEGDSLTTGEANLLLARLTTDTNASVEEILDISLQLYGAMVALNNSGRIDSGPDITTYRILLLALSGRLMALGEAVKLSMEMLESDLQPDSDALLNAMQACHRSHDIGAAERLMDFALESCSDSFRPSLGSYMIMLDMLKKKNSQKAAFGLLEQSDKVRSSQYFMTLLYSIL
jgi:hypothetical protein